MKNSYQDKENCGVGSLIAACNLILHGVQKEKPTREMAQVITKLDEAFLWLKGSGQDV